MAVDLALRAIQDAPDRWRSIDGNFRRYHMPGFPYAIYYRLYPEQLRILAFKHHSRRPDYWRHRLSD